MGCAPARVHRRRKVWKCLRNGQLLVDGNFHGAVFCVLIFCVLLFFLCFCCFLVYSTSVFRRRLTTKYIVYLHVCHCCGNGRGLLPPLRWKTLMQPRSWIPACRRATGTRRPSVPSISSSTGRTSNRCAEPRQDLDVSSGSLQFSPLFFIFVPRQ